MFSDFGVLKKGKYKAENAPNFGIKGLIFLKNSLFQSKATAEPILGQEFCHKIGPDVVVSSGMAENMTETLTHY